MEYWKPELRQSSAFHWNNSRTFKIEGILSSEKSCESYGFPISLSSGITIQSIQILQQNSGFFLAFDVSNLATIITPALYQPPNHPNSRAKISNKYGRLAHIVYLYLLPFFMYAHLGYYLHQIAFKDVSIIANDKVILDHADVMIFDIYFGALVVYLLLALVYYRVR